MRYWIIRQGSSRVRVRAANIAAAREAGARIGFKNPDAVVLARRPHESDHRQALPRRAACTEIGDPTVLFYFTFGQKYREEPHPAGGHPDGWFAIEASSEWAARIVMRNRCGEAWAFCYPEGRFDATRYPRGELERLGTLVIPGSCLNCGKPFSIGGNVYSEAGLCETRISSLCELCFDEITAEPDDDDQGGDDGPAF